MKPDINVTNIRTAVMPFYAKHILCLSILLFILFFNSCRTETTKVKVPATGFCDKIHRDSTVSLASELEDFGDVTKRKSGICVLENGGGSLITRAWLTEYAEESIDIQYFIFSTDNVGLIACDYLVRAADRGVAVRILVDDIMIDAELADILTLDSHENITIKVYNPGVNLGRNLFQKIKKFATDFRGANQRMHNKTFIVDEQVVITGGRNIANEYFDFDHEYNFRDRDVLLLGEVTEKVNVSFIEFWNDERSVSVSSLVDKKSSNDFDVHQFDKLHEYACNPDNYWPQVRKSVEDFQQTIKLIKNSEELIWVEDVVFVSDVSGKNDETKGLKGGGRTTDALIELVKSARQTIEIQTPYLITTKLSKKLFRDAVERGVEVRIMTNSLASTDNLEAFSSYQKDRNELLKTGVKIYEFKPDAQVRRKIMMSDLQDSIDYTPTFGLHAKTMVVDDYISVVGTFNLDPRSANLNTECMVIIKSKKVALDILEGMEVEFRGENSWEISPTFNPDSQVSKIKRIKTWSRKILPKSIL